MKKPTWQAPGAEARRLIVTEPRWTESARGAEFSFSVWMEPRRGPALLLQSLAFSIDTPTPPPADSGTAALAATLLPAMRMGLPLTVEAPVSPTFLANAEEFQDVFSTWIDDCHPVAVSAPPAPSVPLPPNRGLGSWFSLGVDGFDTFRRHEPAITDLLFIHGFDIDLEKQAHRLAVQQAIREAADALGKRLVTIQTNARSFGDAYLWWGHYCGSVLGAAGQLLSGSLDRILWASSASFNDFVAFGTSALTDPLFSSDTLEVIHDGADMSRMGKILNLATDELALRHLRVCWNMEGTARNCGHCDKCLRTMTALSLAGILDRAPTFPKEIDLDAIRALRLGPSQLNFVREHVQYAAITGQQHLPVLDAWRECARRSAGGGLTLDGVADGTFAGLLGKADRDQLIDDLRRWAPDALGAAAARHVPRRRREVFDFLWKNERAALWRALRKGRA